MQLVSVTLGLLPVAPCEERASVLFVPSFKCWNAVMVLPLSLLFTPERMSHFLTLSLSGGVCSPWSPLWCSLGCSPVCLCLPSCGEQSWTQLCVTSTGWSRMITPLSAVEKQMDSEPSRRMSQGTGVCYRWRMEPGHCRDQEESSSSSSECAK